ncbi:hypothetical protein IC229_19950 [Spirosoma sp. BT702]|uniref:Uncharacterized protein n=1 Tax=Spirosoma profusum TaxID=2771354 RepID=A0A927AT93_9BACT|nr:hypothetical protein [Spirosoma profusum]MBD2702930.1 hypothetical protein [Spirosoma profusum]
MRKSERPGRRSGESVNLSDGFRSFTAPAARSFALSLYSFSTKVQPQRRTTKKAFGSAPKAIGEWGECPLRLETCREVKSSSFSTF